MAQILVRKLTSEDDSLLISFLDSCSKQSDSILAYHYPFYRDMLEMLDIGKSCYLGAFLEEQLIGYLPCFICSNNQHSIYNSLPFFGPNAGIITTHFDDHQVHNQLLKHIITDAKQNKALCLSIYTPFLSNNLNSYKKLFRNLVITEKFTQYLDLNNLSLQTGLVGKNIRKALKNNITIDKSITTQKLEEFYSIYYKNCIEFNIPPKPYECIVYLANNTITSKWAHFYFAFQNKEMIGGLIVLSSKTTASYYIPCTKTERRSLQSNTLLIYNAIKDLENSGIRFLNFESSPSRESGVYKFKKKWGCKESTYHIVQDIFNVSEIRNLGQEGIISNFPHFFVYPFNKLPKTD